MTIKICAIVPTYNHHHVLPDIVGRLREIDLPVFIIDDGSNTETREVVAKLHDPDCKITCRHLAKNEGKGIAVMTGMVLAEQTGFSHVIQLDADGQHDLDRIPDFIDAMRKTPTALVTGQRVYHDSIPTSRKFGRWITHVWVWIETLSFHIRDSMCGFRIYPIAESLSVWREEGAGHKMNFDPEIMVRLYWRGTPVIHIPTRVTYPAGNISNFRIWSDNVLISWMHARLVFGMLVRLPRFILRKYWSIAALLKKTVPGGNQHWAEIDERGIYWGMRFLGMVYHFGGRRVCLAMMFPIIAYFFITGHRARTASHDFLSRIAKIKHHPQPAWYDSFRHFMKFGENTLDKIAAWCGEMNVNDLDYPENVNSLFSLMPRDSAVILLVSHFGNIELGRAIASRDRDFRVNVLLHQKNATRFVRVLQKLAPESQVNLIEVNEIGLDTAILLREMVARGEWIVIAADRTAIGTRHTSVEIDFLGTPAMFPQGPFILAHLLQCPVYMVAAWRNGKRFEIKCKKLTDALILPHTDRVGKITEYATEYAKWLEKIVVQQPLQWFNFYNFWSPKKGKNE